MKKFVGIFVAAAGGLVTAWAGASLLMTHQRIYGYDPVYAGLAGVVVLASGILMRQD